jgi:hypothetical protein
LLYSLGRHRVSVFLQQAGDAETGSAPNAERAGFHVVGFRTAGLQVVAVSDADPARVAELTKLIQAAQ